MFIHYSVEKKKVVKCTDFGARLIGISKTGKCTGQSVSVELFVQDSRQMLNYLYRTVGKC